MNFKYLILALCCVTISTVNGQNYTNDIDVFNQVHLAIGLKYNNELIEIYEGSPYVNDTFLEGKIFLNDSLVEKRVLLRHNLYTDDIEVQTPFQGDNNIDKYSSLYKGPSVSAEILFQQYRYFPTFENKSTNSRGAYLITISDGTPYSLLQKNDVVFRPKIIPKTPYDEERDASFEQSKTFYLLHLNGNLVAAPTSKSKWYKEFENHKPDLKKFFKENKIDFNNKKDLTSVMNFLNQKQQ